MPKSDRADIESLPKREEDVGASFTGRYPHMSEFFSQSPHFKDMQNDWADVNFPWIRLQETATGKSVTKLPQSYGTGEQLTEGYKRQGLPETMEAFSEAPDTALGVQAGVRDVKPISKEELMRFLMVNEATNPDPRTSTPDDASKHRGKIGPDI